MDEFDLTTQRPVLIEQARTRLHEVLASGGFTDEDRAKFADEVRDVQEMMDKLEHGVIHIAAFGMVSRGKSALLNALVGHDAFAVGPTHGTTREKQKIRWDISSHDLAKIGVESFEQPAKHGPIVELIDTPGLNEVDGAARALMAQQVARRADLILFVVSGDMLRPELDALAELREAGKPIILVFNMIDQYPDADRDKIYAKIRNERVRELLQPDDVVLAAGRPRAVRTVHREADGSTRESWDHKEPIVTDLKMKILEILAREGQALAALNTMLFVGDVHERIVTRKLELRDDAADRLVWRFTIIKGVAVACNPVAVADIAGGIGTDIAMIFALARLYDIEMSRVGVGKLVVEIGKMAGLFTATEVGTHILVGLAKSALAAGSILTGGASLAAYAAVAPVQALAAGYASRVIGEAAKVYLRGGASWGPAGPKTVVRQILNSLDRESIIRRIKGELEARIRPNA